jgi:hypothetical protein
MDLGGRRLEEEPVERRRKIIEIAMPEFPCVEKFVAQKEKWLRGILRFDLL